MKFWRDVNYDDWKIPLLEGNGCTRIYHHPPPKKINKNYKINLSKYSNKINNYSRQI